MSNTIENNIVKMSFDNRNFEKNVGDSITTIEKLKSKLNFSDAVSSFSDITRAANKVDVSNVSSSVEDLSSSFNMLEEIATGALRRIGEQISDTLVNTAKSLSIDQVTTGMSKYEEKTKAVQTIMNATGLSIEEVNEQLEKLNWYTDETSYSFTDMVSNIGKFTSAGVPLQKAVTAMIGISNEAAVSGQGINEASRAMYNLAQAIGVGSVKLMDWRSIENANMGTKEFKEIIIETAKELGTLDKKGYVIDVSTKKATQKLVTFENFTENLSDGWFSSDVLLEALSRYGSFTEELYTMAQDTGKTASELLLELDATGDGVKSLGEKAFRAAQEAKTFTDAVDSVKEAVASGWSQAFEKVFGDYTEAKELWTDLANYLYDIFTAKIWYINDILDEWRELSEGGRDTLIDAFRDIGPALESYIRPIITAFNEVFGLFTSDDLKSITLAIKDFTSSMALSDEDGEKVTRVFKTIFRSIKDIGMIAGSIFSTVKKLFDKIFGTDELTGLENILRLIGNAIYDIAVSVDRLRSKFDPTVSAIQNLKNIFEEFWAMIKEEFSSFDNIADKFTEWINRVFGTETGEKVNQVFKNIFQIVKDIGACIGSILSSAKVLFDKVFGTDELTGFENILRLISGAISAITSGITRLCNKLDPAVSLFQNLKNIFSELWAMLVGTAGSLGTIADKFSNWFKRIFGIGEAVVVGTPSIQNAMPDMEMRIETFSIVLEEGAEKTETFTDTLVRFGKEVRNVLSKVGPWFVNTFIKIKKAFEETGLGTALMSALESLATLLGQVITTIALLLKHLADIITESDINELGNFLGEISKAGLRVASITLLKRLSDVLEAVGDTIEAFRKKARKGSNVLLKVVAGISLLTLSIIAFTRYVNPDNLASALKSIGGAIAGTMIVLAVLKKIDSDGSKTLKKALIGVAEGILILVLALKLMSDIPNINETINNLGLLLFELVASVSALGIVMTYMLSNDVAVKGIKKFVSVIRSFALVTLILVRSLKKLSEIENLGDSIYALLFIMGGIVSAMYVMAAAAAMSKNSIKSIVVPMLALIGVIYALIPAIHMMPDISLIDAAKLGAVVLGFEVLILGLVGIAAIIKHVKIVNVLAVLIPMVSLIGGLVLIGLALKTLVGIGKDELISGAAILVGLLAGLAAMVLISRMIQKIDQVDRLAVIAGVMVAFAASMAIVMMSLRGIANASIVIAAILGFAGAIAAIVGLSLLVKDNEEALLSLTVAMIAMSASIYLVMKVLKEFADFEWPQLAKMGVVLVGFLVSILALALIGGIASAPILLLSVAMIVLASSILVTSLAFQNFVDAAVQFTETIQDMDVDKFISKLRRLLVGLIDVLMAVVARLAETSYEIADAFLKSLFGCLKAIKENIEDIITEFVGIMMLLYAGILEGIAENIDEIVTAFVDLIAAIINGVAQYIRESQKIGDAFKNLISAIWERFLNIGKWFKKGQWKPTDVSSIFDAGESVGETVITGLKSKVPLMEEEGESIGSALADAIMSADGLGSDDVLSPVITPTLDLTEIFSGSETISNLLNGDRSIYAGLSLASDENNSSIGSDLLSGVSSGVNIVQNNYSPKALSATEIYRQTKNLFSKVQE